MTDGLPRARADRRQMQQIIAGLGEGVILVDPDHTLIWANGAALAMHGVDDLAGLGGNAAEYRARFTLRYRNNHVLTASQYPIERALAGESFNDVVVEVRRAGQEQPHWVHGVRGLTLTDAAGLPDCVVLILRDQTEQYDAQDRFERMFNANPAPAVICRLSDRRYVKVNQGFLDMVDRTQQKVLGCAFDDLDVLRRADRRDLALERFEEWRTIPQMEASLDMPDGSSKFVIVAGQPIDVGDERGMLFTFIDLEARKKAEDALRQSEERFAKSFRLAPVPTMIHALEDGRIMDVNDAFVKTLGFSVAAVTGRTLNDIGLWPSKPAQKTYEQIIAAEGGIRNADMRVRRHDDAILDCLVSAETVVIENSLSVLVVIQDVSDRRRTEEELVAAIEAVMQDTSWFSRTVIEKLANLRSPMRGQGELVGLNDLTGREREVLACACAGLADKEIANRLGLSNSTVRNCISGIYRKIGVKRRSAAVVWARERGFTGR